MKPIRAIAKWRKIVMEDDISFAYGIWLDSPEKAKKFLTSKNINHKPLFNKWKNEGK